MKNYIWPNIKGFLVILGVFFSLLMSVSCRDNLNQPKPNCEAFLDHDIASGLDIVPPPEIPAYRYPKFVPGNRDSIVFIKDTRNSSSLILFDLANEKSQRIYKSDREISFFDINNRGECLTVEEGQLFRIKKDSKAEKIKINSSDSSFIFKANWLGEKIIAQSKAASLAEIDHDGNIIREYLFPIEVRDFWINDSILVVANIQEIQVYGRKSQKLQGTYDITKFFSEPYVNGTLGAFRTENTVSISAAFIPTLGNHYHIFLSAFHDIYRIEHTQNGIEDTEWHRWSCYIPGVGLDVEVVGNVKPEIVSAVIDLSDIPRSRKFGVLVLRNSREFTLFP